mgnify:CR=1 FL=1|tara:strand:- start:497 stop:1714 length:1218 start_codon:yes stop_codon:yes gene_type:complete
MIDLNTDYWKNIDLESLGLKPLSQESLLSKMSKEDADSRAKWALKSSTLGNNYSAVDHMEMSNALQGLNEWGDPIQQGDKYWDLAMDSNRIGEFAKKTKQGAAVDTILKNNPALLMGDTGRANMGNFGGQTAINFAKANVGKYVDSFGLTDQYQTDVDAGLGGQTNEWNLGGRTRADGTLRPESVEYLKSGNFTAPVSSYGPGSGPFAAESVSNPPSIFEIPADSSFGPPGYTYDTTNQTITNPETGAQHDPSTGLDDAGPGKPQVPPSTVDFTNVPPLGGDTATPPPPPTPPLGGDTTTQGGGNWWDGYGSIDDVLAAHQQNTGSNEGGFGGNFDDFMKFMMMMNMMGGMGGGGYGGSQYGYGGLHPGGVMQAYDPLERLQGSLDWFNKSFGSGTQGGTTANVA